MKKFILFICLLWSVAAMAQEPPYTPMRSNYKFRGVRIDSLFMPPAFTDTSIANTIGLNTIEGNVIRVDSVIYVRFNNRWRKQGNGAGTTIDTTSLSNRINAKIENIIRSSDSVYFYKNGVKTFAYKDSIGATNGFVPYTGATQDLNMGNNGITAKFYKVTGTAGNGHIDFKHQSGDPGGQGNSSLLYANSQGYLKFKNDNLYYSTLAMPQTADRVYTYQNKNYVLGDSADIAARVKYTDTSGMLSPYARSISVIKYTDTANMLSPYMKKSDSSLYYTKYRSDTSRTNIYNAIGGKAGLNPTTYWIPFNNGIKFSDSYLIADTPNSILKSQYQGNDIGLKLDFINEYYSLGNENTNTKASIVVIGNNIYGKEINIGYSGINIDPSAAFAQLGDFNNNANGTNLTVDDFNKIIKTQNQGNDIGLKLDFASSDYNLGTSTTNFQILNDSIKLNGLTAQSGDSVVNINPSGKLGKVSIAGKLNKSDSTLYQTKFRTDTMRTNIYATLNGKLNTIDSNTIYSTKFRVDTMRTNLYNRLALELNISDTASMLTNYQRNSAFPVATFGAGSGAAGDTSTFSTTALYGSFYLNAGADTIIVTGYTGVVQGTSASVTPTIWFNDSLNVTAGATKIVNSPSAVTSTTTGNTVTSLDNTKIPPGNFIWVTTGTVTTKPTYFSLTLIGYRKRP